MSGFNVDREYLNLSQQADQLKSDMVGLNTALKAGGYINKDEKGIKAAFDSINKENPGFPFHQFHGYILNAEKLSRTITRFHSRYETAEQFTIARQNFIRKAERHDMWKLWSQKFIRWTLGVFGAVLLYSTIVSLANNFDFIKVPVRDLVIQNGSTKISGTPAPTVQSTQPVPPSQSSQTEQADKKQPASS